jgi:hypothetical protein
MPHATEIIDQADRSTKELQKNSSFKHAGVKPFTKVFNRMMLITNVRRLLIHENNNLNSSNIMQNFP